MSTIRRIPATLALLTAMTVISGCQEPATTPVSADGGLSDLITQVEDLHSKIKTGLEAGEGVDGALHSAFDVLQNLATIGADSGLAAEDREKVHSAAEAMADSYAKIHDALPHGDATATVDYAVYAQPLQDAMDTLKSYGK